MYKLNARQRPSGQRIADQEDLLPRPPQQKILNYQLSPQGANSQNHHSVSSQYTPTHSEHPHLSLNPPKPTPDRKLKSLTKHDSKKHPDRRWAEASHPELSTLDGLLKRNLHLGKFSVSKEREGGGCKQKYKRSEQIRSVIETKKMSSLNKMERKHTEATVSMTHFYNSVSSEASLPAPKNKTELKEPLLDSIINPHDNYEE